MEKVDKTETGGYICANACNDASATDIGSVDNLSPCREAYRPVSVAQIVSGPTRLLRTPEEIHNQRLAAKLKRKAWRREFGFFVAEETGTRFEPQEGLYDPKSAEKTQRSSIPLHDADIQREKANLRSDLASSTQKRRDTVQRVYLWLAEYLPGKAEGGGK